MSESSVQMAPGEKSGESTPSTQTTRRALLKGVFGALSTFGLGFLAYGGYRFLAPGAGGGEPVEIPLSQISVGETAFFQYGGSPGILLRNEEGTFKAFSLVCTHLACTVTWKADKKEFYCPCHDGFFDSDGKVLSGPPPSPLERWKVEVKGDKVVVGAA
jgi:cytochrome b6-f complex iron-sulfur subunit